MQCTNSINCWLIICRNNRTRSAAACWWELEEMGWRRDLAGMCCVLSFSGSILLLILPCLLLLPHFQLAVQVLHTVHTLSPPLLLLALLIHTHIHAAAYWHLTLWNNWNKCYEVFWILMQCVYSLTAVHPPPLYLNRHRRSHTSCSSTRKEYWCYVREGIHRFRITHEACQGHCTHSYLPFCFVSCPSFILDFLCLYVRSDMDSRWS